MTRKGCTLLKLYRHFTLIVSDLLLLRMTGLKYFLGNSSSSYTENYVIKYTTEANKNFETINSLGTILLYFILSRN